MRTVAFRISAGAGWLAVALGAFGAHGMKGVLERHGTEGIWETAVFYHLIHAVLMCALAWTTPGRHGAWICFATGVLVFSGTLYVLAATGIRWLGAITPLGGVALLVGWAWLVVAGPGRETGSDKG